MAIEIVDFSHKKLWFSIVAERCSQLLGMVGVNPTWDDNPDFHIYIVIYIYMFSGFETTKYKAT